MIFKFAVTVKHFRRIAPAKYIGNTLQEPEQIEYDYDDEFIFTYDMKTMRIQGTSWCKDVEPDDVADAIKAYFAGTCYQIANVEQMLN